MKKRPTHERAFADGLAALEKDLNALDARFEHWASVVGEEPLLFSHPVYQYFVHRYSLNARSVHWEPGEVPTAEMWSELRRSLETHPARVMIWEAEPLEETRRELSALGLESLVLTLAGSRPESGDFLSVMQGNAHVLEGAWPDDEHSGR